MKAEDPNEIVESILAASEADETEVRVHVQHYALTRFANNIIHQNLVQNDRSILLRVRLGNRLGECTGNRTGPDDLKRLVEAATEVARLSADDEDLLPLPDPQEYEPVDAFCSETDIAGPGNRAAAVRQIVKVCKAETFTAAGAFNTVSESVHHGNSRGLRASYHSTQARLSVTAMDTDSSGWASAVSRDVREIDAAALAGTALRKAMQAREPQGIEAGVYAVILEPDALATLVEYVGEGFNARHVFEEDSFLSAGRLGSRITGEAINIRCDPYHPLLQGQPFDHEGMPNRRISLVRGGVAEELVYDRLTARKHGAKPSGYSLGGKNSEGAYPGCLVMEGGESSVDEMIAGSDRAILVTRIWYPSLVDPKRLVVTGMTRDGTFLIENGRITHALNNLRLNVPVLDVLASVEALGPQKCCQDALMWTPCVVPAAKLREFRFTSDTTF